VFNGGVEHDRCDITINSGGWLETNGQYHLPDDEGPSNVYLLDGTWDAEQIVNFGPDRQSCIYVGANGVINLATGLGDDSWGGRYNPLHWIDEGSLLVDPSLDPAIYSIRIEDMGGGACRITAISEPPYPACWDYTTQCHGDSDHSGNVNGSDFLTLKASWFKCYLDQDYNPCADFDRNGCVNGSDFLILKSNWFKVATTDCPPGGIWPPYVPADSPTDEPFCGWSDYGLCNDDNDCIVSGCSGQVCGADSYATDCMWRDCYNPEPYGLHCGCKENRCQWKPKSNVHNLDFDVSPGKVDYKIGEPILTTAKLTNKGEIAADVAELGLDIGTLDFEIATPEGYQIHYIGPYSLRPIRMLSLEPGESIQIEYDLLKGQFGNQEIGKYEFETPGHLTIKGKYRGGWYRTIESDTRDFYLRKSMAWVETLKTDKEAYLPAEPITTMVVVRRGNDPLDVVYQGILTLTVAKDNQLIYEFEDNVEIPSGGGSDELNFVFRLSKIGEYKIQAELYSHNELDDRKSIFVTVTTDRDKDGIPDKEDNCPEVYNPDQLDSDKKELCPVCGDGICSGDENNCNCPQECFMEIACMQYVPVCGNGRCELYASPGENHESCPEDCPPVGCRVMTDGYGDVCDNCPYVFNPDQRDSDNDGIGDACDEPPCWNYLTQCYGDSDNSGDVKGPDFRALKISWFKCSSDPDFNPCADFDRDGCVNGSDFLILKSSWFKAVPADCQPGGTWPPEP